jgi:putative flippase GtrA
LSVAARTARALRHPHNWIQLAKFGVVGATGFAINLAVYKALLGIGAHGAAAVSFVVSAASNYWWNRHWTFAGQKGSFALQGMRFYVVSLAAFGVNQLWLAVFLDWLNWGKLVSQAAAIILVTPLNFLGNKLWSFRTHQVGGRSRAAEPRSATASRR